MTAHKTIKWFADLDTSASDLAGGKGANLSELVQAELPISSGFAMTTDACAAFVEVNGLQAQTIDLAAQTRADDSASFESASAEIEALFQQGVIPNELVTEIKKAYGNLTDETGQAVAVRSSATAENLPPATNTYTTPKRSTR
ncbi:PEP/pyruvate-binding domain-containing protein [Rubrobacter aplysinae]|uniref:PEP/pyruvate-binding domain-containing protein n=1 Tax=Rubrobacter aplysinae TaxID=909625 RepID=UPI00064BD1F6|nr:PEP/pyruvate-binding domain-containing protein [Rubrobacter aplysinae]